MIAWLFNEMVTVQREIYLAFGDRITVYAETGDWSQLAVFLPMGIVFGGVHAMTPGHSKTLLAAYSAATPASVRRALGTAFLLSTVHISMSVLIVLLSLPLVSATLGSAGRAPALELISRSLLGLIGVWMIVSAFRTRRTQHTQERSAAFAIFAGLIPCPLTLFVMTFAASQGVTEAGLAFAGVMLIGVAIVLGTIALVANLSGKGIAKLVEGREKLARTAVGTVQVATGLILLVAAWRMLKY